MRRFQKVDVKEPRVENAIKILKGLKPYYEEYHRVRYTSGAIKAAVNLASRYIPDRKLPDKAIDVMDEDGRGADARLREAKRKKTITNKEIEDIVRQNGAHARQKPCRMDDAETSVGNLDKNLKLVLFGENRGPTSGRLPASIKMSRAGLREEEKPIGNYLFTGPTGVGKTEVAQQLALPQWAWNWCAST